MRYSEYFIYTIKEDQKEATIRSHNLLLRGSFICKLASGIYNYLPLGWRVLKKVSDIVREELDKEGAIELLMPSIQPAELWMESGRWQEYGKELLRIKDRSGRDFVYGPTHEEVVTDIVRRFVKSYKELPVNLYHIQTKFRDEMRPRFGLMRGREFIMKDAYSFDASEEGMNESYDKMRRAYAAIFRRCGLEFRVVEADTGTIGGKDSEEFMVLSDTGEDELVFCDSCEYAANVERAMSVTQDDAGEVRLLEKVYTPGRRTIEEVCGFLGIDTSFSAKALVYKNERDKLYCFLVEGDDSLNETKAKRITGSVELVKLSDEEMEELGFRRGYIGPVGIKNSEITFVCDIRLTKRNSLVVGANDEDHHYVGAKIGRDFHPDIIADLRDVKEGEICPRCGRGRLRKTRGIEVGHIFKLGDKYSRSMNATFLDRGGKQRYYLMGCYGIGIGRTAQAAVEQWNDDDGIIWPISIAPFEVELISLDAGDEKIVEYCDSLHNELEKVGFEVLYDDRNERAGVKLKDADLIGIPVRIIVGKKNFSNGVVEISLRRDRKRKLIGKGNVVDAVKENLEKLYGELNHE